MDTGTGFRKEVESFLPPTTHWITTTTHDDGHLSAPAPPPQSLLCGGFGVKLNRLAAYQSPALAPDSTATTHQHRLALRLLLIRDQRRRKLIIRKTGRNYGQLRVTRRTHYDWANQCSATTGQSCFSTCERNADNDGQIKARNVVQSTRELLVITQRRRYVGAVD